MIKDDLDRFYDLIYLLYEMPDNYRLLKDCRAKMTWAKRGVYFFFETGEERGDSIRLGRVVRVGTHALKAGSESLLRERIKQHKGNDDLTGNHRGSIFRKHVGIALANKDRTLFQPTWAHGSSAKKEVRDKEKDLEIEVSKYLGMTSLLWGAINDESGPESDRGYIERNSIALLSNHFNPIDKPSDSWLGSYTNNKAIICSGLWNVNHVDEEYDPLFLNKLADCVQYTIG